jgi:hypothetical protein
MEQIILSCLQAQLVIQRINSHLVLPATLKNDLIWEVKQISPKECKNDKHTERSNESHA